MSGAHHQSPASRDRGLHAASSSGVSPTLHPSPTQEAWPLQTPQAGRLPSRAPLNLHLHSLHLLQATCFQALGPPWVQPIQPPHFSEHGLPLPSWTSWPSCTRAHSVPVHTALLPAGLGCLHLQIPNPARAVGLLEPLNPGQLLRWGPRPTASHQRPHTGHLRGSRSHTHVFGKERLLLLWVLSLLGLLHLQALNEGCSLGAKHGREGAR